MSEPLVCTNCGHVGDAETVIKGHRAIELVLWLCLLLPGIIYSIWRHTGTQRACPACGNANLIPRNSPVAQRFLREHPPAELVSTPEPALRPSAGAVSAGKALGRFVGKLTK